MKRRSLTGQTGRKVVRRAAWLTVLTLAGLGTTARAAEVSEVTSSFYDKDDLFDVNVGLFYNRSLRRGAIRRELTGRDASQAAVEIVKELRYSQTIHTLSLRTEVGLWRDLQLHFELPIVLSDSRELRFAQAGGDPCVTLPEPNCVDRTNSTLVRDGLLDGSLIGPDQVTVAGDSGPLDPATGSPVGAPGGRWLPERSGIDQLYLGLSGALLNQARDPTKPTWIVGFEARISVGDPMEYNPRLDADGNGVPDLGAPEANTSVSRGIHQLHWWMTVSRLFPYLDAWTGFHYMLPVARDSSLFSKTDFDGSGQERSDPRHVGWLEAGVEVIPWEREATKSKITIELSGRLEGIFEGRGYSPLWELLAHQPGLQRDCLVDGPPLSWDNGTYCRGGGVIPYPGITSIEAHLNVFAALAVNAQINKWIKARIGVSLGHEQEHFITTADAGKSFCDPANPGPGCAGRLDLGDPRQVNPMYRPMIDAPGRRLQVAEATIFDFFVSATAMF